MALYGRQFFNGIIVNPFAMDKRTHTAFAKHLAKILKIARIKTKATVLLKNNPLGPEEGTEARVFNYSQFTARLKPEGVPTGAQRLMIDSVTYSLNEWEVKTAITDRAKINSRMNVNDVFNAGDAARALIRAIDSEILNEMIAGTNTITVIPGGQEWSPAAGTDAQIITQIDGAIGRLENAGFEPGMAVMSRAQKTRLAEIGRGIGAGLSFEQFWKDHLNLSAYMVVPQITEVNEDGSNRQMFTPFDNFALIDTEAWGIMSQRPTGLEYFRDTDAGVDLGYIRKYFRAHGIQANACQILNNTNL